MTTPSAMPGAAGPYPQASYGQPPQPPTMPRAAGPYPQASYGQPPQPSTMPRAAGPYPHTPYGQPPQPPKKRRRWLIVLLVILAVMLVGLVSCGALIGAAGKANTEASTEISQSQQAQDDRNVPREGRPGKEDRNAPREVTPGKAFTVGKHETLAGWKVEQDTIFGDAMFNVSGKVKNVSDETSTAFIHFKFIDKSGEVLGNVDCNSGDLEPGQTQVLNCIPDGKFGNYTKVTAEATF
jgi:hypothetical protein